MIKNRKATKIGTAAAMLASVILSGTTVFGYAPMQTVQVTDNVPISKEFVTFNKTSNSELLFAQYDTCFESEDGTVIPVENSDSNPRALICTHDFEYGYADQHFSQSNGGCIVKTYTAKICKKCNHLVIMELVGTATFTKCIHK